MWSITRWQVSPDARQFILPYQVTTTNWIAPLCFAQWQDTENRWLILNVDSRGVVASTETTRVAPEQWPNEPGRWLTIFDESVRQKLVAAGVFPSDDMLKKVQEMQDDARMHAQQQRELRERRAATRSMNR